MENLDYVSFHNHTYYSVMDSLIKPNEFFAKIADLGQSAAAITDHGTLFGIWDAYKAAKLYKVKLIAGCEFNFQESFSDENERLKHIVLVAKNQVGWKNLLLLNKLANDNNILSGKKLYPRINWEMLEKYNDGLLAFTACSGGILGQSICTRKLDKAKEDAQRLKKIFGENLALEIQPNSLKKMTNAFKDYQDQTFVNNQLIKLSKELNIKIVPTTNAHYLNPEDHDSHDLLLAIGSGQPKKSHNRLTYTNEFYVRSREDVRKHFARLYENEIDEWLNNSLYFASLCEDPKWIELSYSNPSGKEYPDFPVKDQLDYNEFLLWKEKQNLNLSEEALYMRFLCFKNLEIKIPKEKHEEYIKRLNEEFEVIEYQHFPGYMLIVADYINFSKNNNVLVGPGRGSIGGSLVGYLLGMHAADPIKYNLIFSRFLNKEKTSPPDIDLDFSPKQRHKVQEYLMTKYGKDNVAGISNINTLTPKPYVKDVSRALQFGGDQKKAVAIGMDLADSISDDMDKKVKDFNEIADKAPLFFEKAKIKYPELLTHSKYLLGKIRALSTHAAGLVISKRPLHEIVSIRKDKEQSPVIEYDKETAEDIGLLKMDLLRLNTLDIIAKTEELIIQNGKELLPFNYELDDEKAYNLISDGNTLCVFQFGTSPGTINLCKKVKPKKLWDLALITALARPAAADLREGFIAVRNGAEELDLLHPSMKRAYDITYGLFEECLMFLAEDMAGWDLQYADNFRKMTKDKGKHPEKVLKIKNKFIQDFMTKHSVTEKLANKVWDEVIERFQGYGFNMSHALLYSMISFHTAWLKAHYPLEFLTANLMAQIESNSQNSDEMIAKIKTEIRKLKIKILPPDVNKSNMTYTILDSNTLMTGLDALKFMGKEAIPEIIKQRPFKSINDFLSKVDGRKVKAPSVAALAAVGGLDSFEMSRKQMFLYSADFKKKLQVWNKKSKEEMEYPWPDVGEWTIPEKYAMEIKYLGEGLTGNTSQVYPGIFDNRTLNIGKLEAACTWEKPQKISGPIKGIVLEFVKKKIKKEDSKLYGQLMIHMRIMDPYGNIAKVSIFPSGKEQMEKEIKRMYGNKKKLEVGSVLVFFASDSLYNDEYSLIFNSFIDIFDPPKLPEELKGQKIMLKSKKSSKNNKKTNELLDEIEDELDINGMSEDEEEDFSFDDAY